MSNNIRTNEQIGSSIKPDATNKNNDFSIRKHSESSIDRSVESSTNPNQEHAPETV